MSYSGKVTRQGVGGTWFKPRNHSNQVVLISFVKKLFIVCLIEHHSLNLMRTNNENGYEYDTKFQRYIQHRGHCRVVVKRPHRMLEEPGSNNVSLIEGCTYFVKKWFIVCLIEHRSSNFMRTNNEKGYKYTNFP